MHDEGNDQQAGRRLGSSVGGVEEGGGRLRSNPSSEIRLQRFRGDGEDGGSLVMQETPDVGRLRENNDKGKDRRKSVSQVFREEKKVREGEQGRVRLGWWSLG